MTYDELTPGQHFMFYTGCVALKMDPGHLLLGYFDNGWTPYPNASLAYCIGCCKKKELVTLISEEQIEIAKAVAL